MLEFIKGCVIDFVLFSGIEGFIFCLFFEKIGGCRKFKWYEIVGLSIINCLISNLLCLYSCRNIYQKAPIELNSDFIGKNEDWHFKRVVLIMVIYLIISLILYYFGFYEICKCIMLSLILVDLMLFKNDKEYIYRRRLRWNE